MMFYGQNCSGRLGEKRTVICVVGSKEDYNFFRLIDELNLKHIKKELDEKHFSLALNLIKKYKISVSIIDINTLEFNSWKKSFSNYPHWFAKIYGIICYNALKPILEKGYMQMDREYDEKNLNYSAQIISKLCENNVEIYIRKESEYPSNRIIVADLFARGYFKGFDCRCLIINRKPKLENDIQKIFRK